VSDRRFRGLVRSYRRERAQILENPVLSWEGKMRAISVLFENYAAKRDALRGAAERRREWAEYHRHRIALFEDLAEHHREMLGRLVDGAAVR
jgi:hypothetical protein